MKIIDRIFQYLDFKGIKPRPFELQIGLSNGYLAKQQKRNADLGESIILKIVENCPEINPYWLWTGKGEMLKSSSEEAVISVETQKPNVNENVTISDSNKNGNKNGNNPNVNENATILDVSKNVSKPNVNKNTIILNSNKSSIEKEAGIVNSKKQRPPLTPEINKKLQDIVEGKYLKPKLIPVYGVSTIGGTLSDADMSPVSEPEGYIEAGGWFPNITAAIYHYGESMKEYPSGCLLALQEIYNRRNIVWGSNYVIETNELRITKRLQTCPDDKNCVMAYSSNESTYSDGRLIHEPLTIYKEEIRRLFLVIGVIKKEQASAPILIKV